MIVRGSMPKATEGRLFVSVVVDCRLLNALLLCRRSCTEGIEPRVEQSRRASASAATREWLIVQNKSSYRGVLQYAKACRMWRHARVVLGYEADMHLAAEGSSAAADVH